MQLVLASNPETIDELRQEYEHHSRTSADPIEWLADAPSIVRRAPHLKPEKIEGWKGNYLPRAGWAAAMDAVDSVGKEIDRFGGVEMVFGT